MNRLAMLTVLVVLTACAGGPRGSAPDGRAGASFDRETERRAVYEAVLRHAGRPDVQRYVLEPEPQGGLGYGGGPGWNTPSKVRRDTIADLRRRPTRPMPRDLDVGVPVEFLSTAEWDGRQALVHLMQSHASLAGRGYFVLLERATAGWRVVEESTTVVS